MRNATPSVPWALRLAATVGLAGCGSESSTLVQVHPSPAVVHVGVDAGRTTASLGSTVHPKGSETTVRVEYGTGSVLDLRSAPLTVSATAESTAVVVELTALEPETEYGFRWVATNAGGSTASELGQFLTLPANRPPETALAAVTVDSVGAAVDIHAYWHGIDADGTVARYELWHSARGDTSWIATTAVDSVFPNIPSVWLLLVRTVDNEGARDPTPAAFAFPDSVAGLQNAGL